MPKNIFKIWSHDRIQKITFVAEATIEAVLTKALNLGLSGNRIVLESDGSIICDDETLEWHAQEKSTFMLLDYENQWTPSNGFLPTSINPIDQISLEEADIEFRDLQGPSTSGVLNALPLDTASTSTLSVTSSTFSSHSSTNEEAMKLFDNFEVPWKKFPPDINEMFLKKEYLGKKLNTVANIVIDEMREFSKYLPMGIIRMICQKIAEKYPHSFLKRDKDENFIIATPIDLVTIMKNRNNFLNRAPKRRAETFEPTIPLKERKVVETFQKTCSNWQPVENDSVESVENKKKVLQNLYLQECLTEKEEENISKLMKECFAFQRLYFNNRENIPHISEIQNNWPFIFKRKYLHQHFNQLMNLEINNFEKEFLQNKSKVIDFFRKKKLISNSTSDEDILKAISLYFKEKVEFLFKFFNEGTTLEDIKNDIPTNTPFIAIVDIASSGQKMGYIFMEKNLTEKYEDANFLNMMIDVVCYFYIFNLRFPENLSKTLEFLVRYYLKYYPTVMRGEKKNINMFNNINTLIKKLN